MRDDLGNQLPLPGILVIVVHRTERTPADVDLALLADHDQHGFGIDAFFRLLQQDSLAVEGRLHAAVLELLGWRQIGIEELLQKRARALLPRPTLGVILGAPGVKLRDSLVERRHKTLSARRRDQPTEPSRLIEMSFCASTANSIGNCWSTSLTKPLTTSATASSAERPRWRQ